MTVRSFDIAIIDEVIHGRARLGIMTYLMVEDPAEFTTLKTKLGLTEGTLSVHLRKLETVGYVRIDKTFKGRRPLTRVHLTDAGREAFDRYLKAMSNLLRPASR